MTGLRVRFARAVPSVLLALCCAVLAAIPAGAAVSVHGSPTSATDVAVTAAYHVDAAALAPRSGSPVGSQHNTPASDVGDGLGCGAPANGPVARESLPCSAWAVALGPLPGVRAPPGGETT